MNEMNRRQFCRTTAAGAAGLTLAGAGWAAAAEPVQPRRRARDQPLVPDFGDPMAGPGSDPVHEGPGGAIVERGRRAGAASDLLGLTSGECYEAVCHCRRVLRRRQIRGEFLTCS